MGFMDDARVEADKLAGGNKLAIIKRKLDKEEFAEFAAALNDKTIPCSAIQRVLKSRGLVISESTVRRYRQHNVV